MADQSVETLIARLERERQQADSAYNAALTALDAAIQAVSHFPDPPPDYDAAALGAANHAWDILPSGAPVLDRSLKGRLRSFVWRIVGPSLETQRQFNASVIDHLNRNVRVHQESSRALSRAMEELRRQSEELHRFESLLVQHLMTITAYIDTKVRALGGTELRERLSITEQRVLALKRDIENSSNGRSAASVGGAAATTEAATYVGFEDRFRGPQDEIRRRVEDYLPILVGAHDVVDVGCGRGELLDLLREHGISARGVDANPAMVEICRARGLEVGDGDALTFLAKQADGAVGGLVAIQVVEHFEPAYLTRFLETAYHKMRRGAPLILETVNPACWMAFFETYIRDLTHQHPLHPDTLRYMVQATGFERVDVQMRQPVGEGDRLERIAVPDSAAAADPALAALAGIVNAHADKLNSRLFSFMDYAVIATR